MRVAILEAERAVRKGERPFGCVIVADPPMPDLAVAVAGGTGVAWDPTRHSEIEAIRELSSRRRGPLDGYAIYSTHEPCMMCTGAILHAKLSRVVFGSYRTDLPGLFRAYDLHFSMRFGDTSHPPEVVGGVLREECIRLFDKEFKHGGS